jgi:predicted transcriptional regulator
MATISFKADEDLNKKLKTLAKKKGITTSAYIKLILTKGVNGELIEITENGLTVAEELEILDSDKNDKIFGPFTSAKAVMAALKK